MTVFFLAAVEGLQAHQISAVAAKASFSRAGTYRFDLSLDVTASADPSQDQLISPEKAALDYLKDALEFQFDEVTFVPAFGPLKVVERTDPYEQQGDLVQLCTEATGPIPPDAKEFRVRLSPEAFVALIMMVSKDGITQRRAQTIFAGEVSRPVDLGFVGQPVVPGDPFLAETLAARPEPGFIGGLRGGAGRMLAGGGRRALIVLTMLLLAATVWQTGLQVILFWAGSFAGHFLIRSTGWAVTPFLGNLLLGVGLVGLALDNVARARIDWSRYGVATVVGCLLGMASRDVEYERSVTSLMGYHEGLFLVMMLLAVVLWLVIGPFRSQPWYQQRLVVPLSLVIAGVGLFWVAAGFFIRA